ncbi:MAG: Lrp/AsnC family transcriptional regulator [Bacteroidia bacterium]|nr:Lrp/AsnC family transcriptional regulator [Bacteroidia bacterium]
MIQNKNGISLDLYDIKILGILQTNSKIAIKEIAHKISLSVTPTHERIKKLEKAGVIKAYVAILDAHVLRKGFIVFMHISIKEHSKGSRTLLIEKLLSIPQVEELYHTSGVYDFSAKIRVRNVTEYSHFLTEEVSQIDNIKDLNSSIVLNVLKETTVIDPS